jgi:hypothetical protein
MIGIMRVDDSARFQVQNINAPLRVRHLRLVENGLDFCRQTRFCGFLSRRSRMNGQNNQKN